MSIVWPTKVSCSTAHLRNSHTQIQIQRQREGARDLYKIHRCDFQRRTKDLLLFSFTMEKSYT